MQLIGMPALLLGWILATIYGAGLHFWRGRSAGDLPRYLIASWMGFLAGHLLGALWPAMPGRIGMLQALSGTLGAWLALFIAHRIRM